jgi:hypothetical protein
MRGRHKDTCKEDRRVLADVSRCTREPGRLKSKQSSWEIGSG